MMRKAARRLLLCTALASVSGCTSTEQALDPSAVASSQGSGAGGSAVSALTSTRGPAVLSPEKIASAAAAARVEIAPIIGATPEAEQPLTERLRARAAERGLGIAAAGDGSPATHIIKGYFSAISEGPGTTVIYVWDVLDPAGNRLHRIQGQQAARGRGEGWAGVPASTMQAIADQTVDQLLNWLAAGTG